MADLRYALTTGSPAGYDGIYTDLQLWWNTECRDYDFVANGNRKIIECFNDWPGGYNLASDLDWTKGSGYVANATFHPIMESAAGSRHNGTIGSGFAVLSAGNTRKWFVRGPHTIIRDIEMRLSTFSNTRGIDFRLSPGDNPLLRGMLFSGAGEVFVENLGYGATVDSCIFIVNGNLTNCIQATNRNDAFVKNCTITGANNSGIAGQSNPTNVENCAILNCGTAYTNCTGNYNASDDGTAPGANSIQTLAEPDFVDYANDDLHIDATSSLYRIGNNIYDGSDEQTDIDGELWPSSGDWDIGADYVTGAAPVADESPIMFGTNF